MQNNTKQQLSFTFSIRMMKFGPEKVTTYKFTVDDYVRVMGVIFNDKLLHSYLPNMMGTTKSGNHNEIDGNRPGARSGFRFR